MDTKTATPETQSRLVSLDAFRGFTMFWLMGGKPFFMALSALGAPVTAFIGYQLTHSDWVGLRYYDLIWPSFMLMVGVSIPFSFARRSLTQTRGQIMRKVWRRGILLFLLGSLRTSMSNNAPLLVELSSALQPIALAYVAASYMAGRRFRAQVGVAAGILIAYALLLALVPAPSLPPGTYELNRNLVTAVDQALIGRTLPDGWGTVLSAIPTISTTLLGLLFGQVLMSARPQSAKVKIIGFSGLGCLAAGLAISPLVPVIMKLWTTSYGLMSAGWSTLLFLLFYWIVDVRGCRKWTLPLVVIGNNAIAAYLGPSIMHTSRIASIFTKPLAQGMGAFGPLFAAAVVLLVNWSILFWMYKRKIFLRV